MQENNRHILLKGLSELPEHYPPATLWERIEVMKLTVPHDALPVHKPFASTWEAVHAGIASKPYSRRRVLLILSLFFLVFAIGGTLYYLNYYGNTSNSDQEGVSIVNTEAPLKKVPDEKDELAFDVLHKKKEEDHTGIAKENLADDNVINYQSGPEMMEDEIISVSVETRAVLPDEKICPSYLKPFRSDYIPFGINIFPENISYSRKLEDPFYDCGFNKNHQSFSITPGFEYQFLLNSNIPPGTKNKYWYSFDIRLNYKLNRFSIEAGIGVGFSKDKAEVTYNYLTNEIIHTYVYVDSIYYDPVTGTTQFFTTTVDVYDSVPHSGSTYIDKKYTYLKIPVELGYDLVQRKKFCIALKAGFDYYKEIAHTEEELSVNHENSRVTFVDTDEAFRRKELFRFNAGLEFRYHTNDHFYLTAKPVFGYYLSNIYETGGADKAPISLGIRLGLLYRF